MMRPVKSKIIVTSIKHDIEEEPEESDSITWSNFIFLPFNPVFKFIILIFVILKCTLGPIKAVYHFLECTDVMDKNEVLSLIKYLYGYLADIAYFVDTFIHILHRQVTDKAMRKEHLPKSSFLLLVDLLALIPFYALVSSDTCAPVQLWPNVLCFTEFFIVYRVVEYFSLATTHSFWNLIIGFAILLTICINSISCFFLLLTKHGLCANCKKGIYDWRKFILPKANRTDEKFATYIYGFSFVSSFALDSFFDETRPSTILEYIVVTVFMISGYLMYVHAIMPKLFAEWVLSLRRIITFHQCVTKIVEEAKRRNPSPHAHVNVLKFYTLMWQKRKGITYIPEIISELPRSLRVDIRQDLVWPVYYHSITLRKTSASFKRWLSEFVILDYKLPGEKIFVGPSSHSNMFYLRSGIVELISADDGVTQLLSLSDGTVFGDVSFFVPPLHRNFVVRCVTYCEVYVLLRSDILKAAQKYPVDRRYIIESAKERLKHARTLYTCKQHVRGLDRTEDEGIAWLKRRWWEISDTVGKWKKMSGDSEVRCEIPPEEAIYHCAKYIGQLVLCDTHVKKKTLFTNVKFPWILESHSTFVRVWQAVLLFTVYLALLTYPANVSMATYPIWFIFIQYLVDFVYSADICISLLTSTKKDSTAENFTSILFDRFKSMPFLFDILATVKIEMLMSVIGLPQYSHVCQLNRLLRIYVLFNSEFVNRWNIMKDPIFKVLYKVILSVFCYIYITSYLIFIICAFEPNTTTSYFFGDEFFPINVTEEKLANYEMLANKILGVPLAYVFETLFVKYIPYHLNDIYIAVFFQMIAYFTFAACKARYISYLYLRDREQTYFRSFATNLKIYYKYHRIHPELLKRLDRYLECQWKYYKGTDILRPNTLVKEPFDIFWKVHGEVAEKVIANSMGFESADPALVREIAIRANFSILPRNATPFLFGVLCRNMTWIVQGSVQCEYPDDSGIIQRKHFHSGDMISVTAVLLQKPTLKTYTSCTECEIIYIPVQEFYNILKRHPQEMYYLKKTMKEFDDRFNEMFNNIIEKKDDYMKTLRDNIFHSRVNEETGTRKIDFTKILSPDSKYMFFWLTLRSVTVILSIFCGTFRGGSGAVMTRPLIIISDICDVIAYFDIILKMCWLKSFLPDSSQEMKESLTLGFWPLVSITTRVKALLYLLQSLTMPYYNSKGILIRDIRMRITHYLTRGFLMDFIGVIPWYRCFKLIMAKEVSKQNIMLLNTICKFAHIYIVMDFFSHIADVPSIKGIYVSAVKWHVVLILSLLCCSNFLVNRCIYFTYDSKDNIVNMTRRKECWMPVHTQIDEKITDYQLHLVYVHSIILAQSSYMGTDYGNFRIDQNNLGPGLVLLLMGVISWFVWCHYLTLLILSARGDTLFQHGVVQLERFLAAERVEKSFIKKVVAHFSYWWTRTRGINIQYLMSERIGIVFRQDLSYFFYKETFAALDTLLDVGDSLSRQLSSACFALYFRPNEPVMRELDLVNFIYILHQGKVTISKHGVPVEELIKGSIFGPLNSSQPATVACSAHACGYADILQIPVVQFHDIISDEVRSHISKNPQSIDDYMACEAVVEENPYNTIEYILRGRKTIQMPVSVEDIDNSTWMTKPVKIKSGSWYSKWLFFAWLISPSISSAIVMMLGYLPIEIRDDVISLLLFSDIIHLCLIVSEFYTIDLVVRKNKLVTQRVGFRSFTFWTVYIDMLSILVPLITFGTGDWKYQLARLLRLRLFYEFNVHFCNYFGSRANPIIMKIVTMVLFLHAAVCGWIYVACQDYEIPAHVLHVPEVFNSTIDYDEWVHPTARQGGCPRMTRNFKMDNDDYISFLIPRKLSNDYIVALVYIIMIHTSTPLEIVVPLNIKQSYYLVFIDYLACILYVWMLSVAIGAVYTKYRELYQYDYNVKNLATYLEQSGLSPVLIDSVKSYTSQLWKRQRGNWLPELAHQAPICIREDLFAALYLHHFMMAPIFKDQPEYFLRQMVAKLQRVVLFPGKSIVQEGDIFPCIYFIHQGEVEKWYTDQSGDSRMLCLLTSNNLFGTVPFFFSTPFTYSYSTRTVVDMVYLKRAACQELLTAYPDIKERLISAAVKVRKDQAKAQRTQF